MFSESAPFPVLQKRTLCMHRSFFSDFLLIPKSLMQIDPELAAICTNGFFEKIYSLFLFFLWRFTTANSDTFKTHELLLTPEKKS